MSRGLLGHVGPVRFGSTLRGLYIYACLCAGVLLVCCCGLLVAICGPPVWAREARVATFDPEPEGEPAPVVEEAELASYPAPEPDEPDLSAGIAGQP